jgi:predicted helicase
LLAQTAREWALDARHPFRSLFVCSDESVADKAGTGYDEPISNVADLGLPVTTDPQSIARFLAEEGRRVVFSTYQSSPMIAAAMQQEPLSAMPAEQRVGFDLVVADEAHRCAGPGGGAFATVLDDDLLRARWRLFMTATPRVYTTRVREVTEEQEIEIASMDELARFGPVLHRLSFAGAIDRDLLSDYRVLVVGVTDEEARQLAESGAFVTPDGERSAY